MGTMGLEHWMGGSEPSANATERLPRLDPAARRAPGPPSDCDEVVAAPGRRSPPIAGCTLPTDSPRCATHYFPPHEISLQLTPSLGCPDSHLHDFAVLWR